MPHLVSNPSEALERFDKLSSSEQKATYRALQDEVLRRCTHDGLFFLRFVKTRDEVDPDNTVKPFPIQYDYLRTLWREIETHQKVIIAKSRQVLVSWLACAFAVWWARRRPNQYVVIQTQVWDDATKLVCMAGGDRDATYLGRCQFIERHMPPFMRVKIKESEGQIAYENGSMIEALPGGADKVRGKVPSLVIEDEFAYQSEARGVWTALAPLVQKGMKLVIVSTPCGAEGSTFFHLYHGTPIQTPTSG